MENIEGISQEEFDYFVANPEELTLFMQSLTNQQLFTQDQLAQALDIVQGL